LLVVLLALDYVLLDSVCGDIDGSIEPEITTQMSEAVVNLVERAAVVDLIV